MINLGRIAANPFGRFLLHKLPRVSGIAARVVADLTLSRGALVEKRIEQNMRAVFPALSAPEIAKLAKKYRRSMFEYAVEQMHLDLLSHEELVRHCTDNVTVTGREHLHRALDASEPVVVFTPHYGNFAIASLRIGLEAEGRKNVHFFFNPAEKNPYSPRIQRLFGVLDRGVGALMNDRAGLVKASRALDRGDLVGLMPDVAEVDPRALFVPFFGRLAVAMGGTAHLALRSNATLLPLYAWRVAAGRFQLRFGPAIPLVKRDTPEESVYETTAAIFRNMQEQIAALPEHWMYWDTFSSRVYPGVALAETAHAWHEQLATLRRLFAPDESELGAFLAQLSARIGSTP